MQGRPPTILISIGDAWVDPGAVIAVDSAFDDEDPSWPRVKVTLMTGQVLYGMRDPARVVSAIRHPELDQYDEAQERETDGAEPESAASRARRRQRPPNGGSAGPRPLRPGGDDSG